jgi:organic hydroperoxide reductase OsmC/OhrA
MSPSAVAAEPRVKPKTFTYRTGVRWTGRRTGTLTSADKPDLPVASPPEFRGEAGVWTPEDLLVASLEACTLMTFVALAEKQKLPIVSWESESEGHLEPFGGRYRFVRVVLRPSIVVGAAASVSAAEALLHEAHERCFVANSLRTEVLIEPVIRSQEASAR